MINLALAEFLFAVILLIAAYFASHTINGCIQAAVADSLGDPTAKDEGYLSLNPLMHIDLFGLLALVFLGIGWFQTVPLDPYAYTGPWRYIKLLAAFCTEAFVSVILATLALCVSVLLYGYSLTTMLVIKLFTYFSKSFLLFFSSTGHLNIAELFVHYNSTLAIVFAFFLISVVYLNILIATISIIFNGFRYALIVGFERGYTYMEYADYLAFLGPFLVVYVLGDKLVSYLLHLAEWGACTIAHIFGA